MNHERLVGSLLAVGMLASTLAPQDTSEFQVIAKTEDVTQQVGSIACTINESAGLHGYPIPFLIDRAYAHPDPGALVKKPSEEVEDYVTAEELISDLDYRLPFPLKSSEISDTPSHMYRENIKNVVADLARDLEGLPLSFIERGFIQGIAFRTELRDENDEVVSSLFGDDGILRLNMTLPSDKYGEMYFGPKAMWQGILKEAGLADCDEYKRLMELDTEFMTFGGDASRYVDRVLPHKDVRDVALDMLRMGAGFDEAWDYFEEHTQLVLLDNSENLDSTADKNFRKVLSIVNGIDPKLSRQLLGAAMQNGDDRKIDTLRETEKLWRRWASERALRQYLGYDKPEIDDMEPIYPASRAIDSDGELDLPYIDVPVGEYTVGVRFDHQRERLYSIVSGVGVGEWGTIEQNIASREFDELYVRAAFSQILGVAPEELVLEEFVSTREDGYSDRAIAVDATDWEGFSKIVEK